MGSRNLIFEKGDKAWLLLNHNQETVIDLDDLDKVRRYHWRAHFDRKTFYARTTIYLGGYQGPSLKDIAKATGISEASIFKALNNQKGVSPKARTKILSAAESLRYIPTSDRPKSKQKVIYLHQLLCPDFKEVDHIDRNGLNNCRSNLRDGSNNINRQNYSFRKDNISGYRGVFWARNKQAWIAQIYCQSKCFWLGQFHDPEQAARVYDAAAKRLFPPGAYLNFPNE